MSQALAVGSCWVAVMHTLLHVVALVLVERCGIWNY
jgi:hypothetical protein